VHFMETKDEALSLFMTLILRLKEESHYAMGAIRSDNDNEIKNDHFDAFCHDQALEHQFSSPYVP
jgi:hypothetical protein